MKQYQKYKDFGQTTNGRLFLNKELIPKWAYRCPDGEDVLWVGIHKYWDYSVFYNSPAKLCNFYTIDILAEDESQPAPDYQRNIEESGLEDNRFAQIVMIGVTEYLHHPEMAYEEIYRILKPGGIFIVSYMGKDDGTPNKFVEKEDIFKILKAFKIREIYLSYERGEEPSSIIVVCEKEVK